MMAVRYMVDDVAAAVRFYTSILDFAELERFGPAMAIVGRDGLQLWLAGPGSSAARPLRDGRKPVPGGWNRLVVGVDDLDAVMGRLHASGAVIGNEPIAGPGGRQALIEDPSGNPVELFQSA